MRDGAVHVPMIIVWRVAIILRIGDCTMGSGVGESAEWSECVALGCRSQCWC